MAVTKKTIIDKYIKQFQAISNIRKGFSATGDGWYIDDFNLEESEKSALPAFLSGYSGDINNIAKTGNTSGHEISYHLTERGFMVFIYLAPDAMVGLFAEGRENTGQVLRLAQQFLAEYQAK